MAVQLTEAEQELAKKLIANMESRARSWPRHRLIGLVLAALVLGLAVVSFVYCADAGREVFVPVVRPDQEITASEVAFEYQLKLNMAMASMGLYAISLMCAAGGMGLLVNVLCRWRSHQPEALYAKLLCAQVRPSPCECPADSAQGAEPEDPPET